MAYHNSVKSNAQIQKPSFLFCVYEYTYFYQDSPCLFDIVYYLLICIPMLKRSEYIYEEILLESCSEIIFALERSIYDFK